MRPLRNIPEPSLRRLPGYLRLLDQMREEGVDYVSSTDLARRLAQDPTQIRKDLAAAGVAGTPRLGFPVTALRSALIAFLGWNRLDEAFLIGAGHLGQALIGYEGFRLAGLRIVAAFDSDPAKSGCPLRGIKVFPMDKLANLARRMRVHIGILAVPAQSAQDAADQLIRAGVRGIWNFAPRKLIAPPGVIIENADLTPSFAALAARLKPLLDNPTETRP